MRLLKKIELPNIQIELSGRFNIELEESPTEVKVAFQETLELFLENPYHPSLRSHLLKEKYYEYRSIDVTGDWRALFRVKQNKDNIIVLFHILGTHSQLYGKEVKSK